VCALTEVRCGSQAFCQRIKHQGKRLNPVYLKHISKAWTRNGLRFHREIANFVAAQWPIVNDPEKRPFISVMDVKDFATGTNANDVFYPDSTDWTFDNMEMDEVVVWHPNDNLPPSLGGPKAIVAGVTLPPNTTSSCHTVQPLSLMEQFIPSVISEHGAQGSMWWTNVLNGHFVNRATLAHDDDSSGIPYREPEEGQTVVVDRAFPVARHPTQPEFTAVVDLYIDPRGTEMRVQHWSDTCCLAEPLTLSSEPLPPAYFKGYKAPTVFESADLQTPAATPPSTPRLVHRTAGSAAGTPTDQPASSSNHMNEDFEPPSFAGVASRIGGEDAPTPPSTRLRSKSPPIDARTQGIPEEQQQTEPATSGTEASPTSEADEDTNAGRSPVNNVTMEGNAEEVPDFLAPDPSTSPYHSPRLVAPSAQDQQQTAPQFGRPSANDPSPGTPSPATAANQPVATAHAAGPGTAIAQAQPSASPFGSGVGNLFETGPPKQAVSIFATPAPIATHRGFEPIPTQVAGPALPPPTVPSATTQGIPPPPPQTPAQLEAAAKAKKLFDELEYAYGEAPQPVRGCPGTYVVRQPSDGLYRLWRNNSATDQDELTYLAEQAEGAGEPKAKRKQRCDADSWQNAVITVQGVYPPTGEAINVIDIPGHQSGEYSYVLSVAVMGGAAPLQPKPSSVLSGRRVNQQGLLVLYAAIRDRFDQQSAQWMDSWAIGKLNRDCCVAHLAGLCNDADCRRVHLKWSASEISSGSGTEITRHYNDRKAHRFDGPMAPMDERQPRGDGLAAAELMWQTTNASIDTNHRHVLQQFKRPGDSTPRRNTCSASANPQLYVAPTADVAQVAADRTNIGKLAAASYTWGRVQAALATGGDIDVSQSPDPIAVDAATTALEQLLQRTAGAPSQQ